MSDKGPHSDFAYGVKSPVNLASLWKKQRARVEPTAEFNDLDRNWRKQYLMDQKLTHNDGNILQVFRMPEYRRDRYNIFRRIGRFPLDRLEDAMIKGGVKLPTAMSIRRGIGALGKVMVVVWTVASLFSDENINNWEFRHTARVYKSMYTVNPNRPDYAEWKAKHIDGRKNPDDFYDLGFKESTLYK